eukprot:13029207-Ditylum_brightwellii.AAC.1
MTDQTSVAHGTHKDEEYEDQLVWDTELEEAIDDEKEDTTMEPVKEIGEKRKADEKEEQHAKQRKNEFNLNTQKEVMDNDIKEKIRERGERALEAENGFQTEVHMERLIQ